MPVASRSVEHANGLHIGVRPVLAFIQLTRIVTRMRLVRTGVNNGSAIVRDAAPVTMRQAHVDPSAHSTSTSAT